MKEWTVHVSWQFLPCKVLIMSRTDITVFQKHDFFLSLYCFYICFSLLFEQFLPDGKNFPYISQISENFSSFKRICFCIIKHNIVCWLNVMNMHECFQRIRVVFMKMFDKLHDNRYWCPFFHDEDEKFRRFYDTET